MSSPAAKSSYVPALGYRILTRFYEPVVRWTMKDDCMKGWILDALGLRDGMRVADIGCGPGALVARIAAEHPNAEVFGVDGDPEVLALARAKLQDGHLRATLLHGLATDPPLERGSFDRVVVSLVLHHLSRQDKERTLRAAHALLRSEGQLLVVDWGEAQSVVDRLAFLSIQLLDGFANTADHVRGLIPDLMRSAGFDEVREARRERTVYGVVSFYRGVRP
ncbi:MAG: methyltransferase domain-containing protein [Deltaproteobacteria bacterium]|nr:methyltransferase domain-containing protein [Deltaproteobacteria bacterium]